MGETKAASSMVKLIKSELKNAMVVVSSITETGHAEALRSIPTADHHIYLPFDFGWIIRPIVGSIKPDMVLLCESDFWYNFLSSAKAHGSTIAVMNGKISERSQKLFNRIPFFAKSLFGLIDRFCVQNNHYRERFESLGVPESKIIVTGNMKFDDVCPLLSQEQLKGWKKQLCIEEDDQVLVVGSTHDPEERKFLNPLKIFGHEFPALKAILVPRHPERFNEVASIMQEQNHTLSALYRHECNHNAKHESY